MLGFGHKAVTGTHITGKKGEGEGDTGFGIQARNAPSLPFSPFSHHLHHLFCFCQVPSWRLGYMLPV